MTPTSEKRSPSKKAAVSSMSPAEVYMLHRLNAEDASYSVNEAVMDRIEFVCDLMNKMLDNYGVPYREKMHYAFERLCSANSEGTDDLDVCAQIIRKGHQTIDIQHSIIDPDPIDWKSKLIISWANGPSGAVSSIPIQVESSLTSRWGPNLEETCGTYCHTLSPDFDLELVKAIFNP